MPNQIKEQKNPQDNSKKKSIKGKIIFILIALVSIGTYLGLNNYQNILNASSTPSNEHEVTDFEQSSTVAETNASEPQNQDIKTDVEQTDEIDLNKDLANQNPLSASNLPSESAIIRFGPDLTGSSPEELGPYDQEAEVPTDACKYSSVEKELLIESLTEYRTYVASANELIIRFLKNENYSEQLDKLKTTKLPSEITDIVNMMEEHLVLLDETLTSKQIFPVNYKYLEKLIKISKNNNLFQKRLELEDKITKKLKILTSYIYSSKLQEQFLGTIITTKSTRQ